MTLAKGNNEFIKKQLDNKFDDKKRKAQEAKTKNVNVRCKQNIKERFVEMSEKTGKSQADVFEDLVVKGKVIVRPYAKEAVEAIATIDGKLHFVAKLLKMNNIAGAEEFIQKQINESEAIKDRLYYQLRKDV